MVEKGKIERKEFGFLNLDVEMSSNEVKIWACNKNGVNQFRLQARGKVHAATISDIIVTKEQESGVCCPKCKEVVMLIKEGIKVLYATVKCPYCGYIMNVRVSTHEDVPLKVS